MKLRKVRRHVKNYRPLYLVMCGEPKERPHLVYFGTVLRQSAGTMVIYAQVRIKAESSFTESSFKISSSQICSASDIHQRNPHDKGYLPGEWLDGGKKKTSISRKMLKKAGELIRKNTIEREINTDVQGFFDKVSANSLREGLNMFIQLSGLGVLRPNVIVMGFKDD